MARETAKKNVKSNAARIQLFRRVTVALFAIQIVWAWLYDSLIPTSFGSAFSLIGGLTFWVGQELVCISLLEKTGAPEYDSSGDLTNCTDLSDPNQLGVMSYAQDVLWVCWAVQVLVTTVSSYLVVLYLPVPALGAYKGFSYFISPLLAARRAQQAGVGSEPSRSDDPRSRLQRRREELRARKGKPAKEEK
jgi:hypothetical protein